MEAEKRRQKEAIERKAANAIVDKATELVTKVEEDIEKLAPAAEALAEKLAKDVENPAEAMAAQEKEIDAAMQAVNQAQESVSADFDSTKSFTKGPYAEARQTLTKLKAKLGQCTQKCKKLLSSLHTA